MLAIDQEMRELLRTPGVRVRLDRRHGNLAMNRHRLKSIEAGLEI